MSRSPPVARWRKGPSVTKWCLSWTGRTQGAADARKSTTGSPAAPSRDGCHGHGADPTIVDLEPLMAENQPRDAVVLDVESAVETLPIGRGHGTGAEREERTGRMIGDQGLDSAAVAGAAKAGDHDQSTPVAVDLRGPEVGFGPESRRWPKHSDGTVPVLEVPAPPGVEADPGTVPRIGVGGAVKPVCPLVPIDQHIRIADANLAQADGENCRRGPWPSSRKSTRFRWDLRVEV